MVDLLTEEIDVSIRIGPLSDSEQIARKLGTIELWPCASPAYLGASPAYLAERGTPRTVEDLDHRLIAHTDRRIPWSMGTPSGAVQDIQTGPGTVIPEPAVAKIMLLASARIAWLPDFDARPAVADGTLVRILDDHPTDAVGVHAIYPSHRSLSEGARVHRRWSRTWQPR